MSGFLWESLGSLARARQSQDPSILIKHLLHTYEIMTGKSVEAPSSSRYVDILLVLGGLTDTITSTKDTNNDTR